MTTSQDDVHRDSCCLLHKHSTSISKARGGLVEVTRLSDDKKKQMHIQ